MTTRLRIQYATAVFAAICLMTLAAEYQATAQTLSFVENGVLYYSTTTSEPTPQRAALDIWRILDNKPEKNSLLYLTIPEANATDAVNGSALMLLNTANHAIQPVARNVITAVLSPDATKIVLWNKNQEIQVVAPNGAVLQEIGTHGAAPIFSHDGNLVAYEKLADHTLDSDPQSLFELAQGIAIHDLRTGEERLVTHGGIDDFAPVGFSRDMRKLYFNSTRPFEDSPQKHIASLWVVDLTTGKTERLTNTNEEMVNARLLMPVISQNALWTSDRTTIISSNNAKEGVWMFTLSRDGAIAAIRAGDGDFPQWSVPDKSIVFRTITNGNKAWQQFDIPVNK